METKIKRSFAHKEIDVKDVTAIYYSTGKLVGIAIQSDACPVLFFEDDWGLEVKPYHNTGLAYVHLRQIVDGHRCVGSVFELEDLVIAGNFAKVKDEVNAVA